MFISHQTAASELRTDFIDCAWDDDQHNENAAWADIVGAWMAI